MNVTELQHVASLLPSTATNIIIRDSQTRAFSVSVDAEDVAHMMTHFPKAKLTNANTNRYPGVRLMVPDF